MGVHGLWRLIEPSGKPVPLETLENKILAVDISIWLHQAVKGFQDARGAQLPNAHLLGIYHRLCKLLYFRIKPVFVFDGGVPILKKQTIAKRNQQKTKNLNDATNIQQKLLSTLLKHSAVQKAIESTDDTQPKNIPFIIPTKSKDDMFNLPEPISSSEMDTTYNSDTSDTETDSSPTKQWGDLHTIDEKSKEFKSLPAEVRHEILTELKEQRKQSSWGRLHELPKQSGDFAQFQMKRLLKRFAVQVSLEEAEKEMGGHSLSLNELEKLLTEEGIVTVSKNEGKRIASNEHTRFLYIKDVKKAIEDAKNEENNLKTIIEEEENDKITSTKYSEYERDLEAAIKLSLQDTTEIAIKPDTPMSINEEITSINNDIPCTSKEISVQNNLPSTSKHISSTSKEIPSTSKEIPSTSKEMSSTSKEIPSTSKEMSSTSIDIASTSKETLSEVSNLLNKSSDDNVDSEYQRDLEAAIKLSLQETESHDNYLDSISEFIYESDSESDCEMAVPKNTKMNPAERYMMEYADLTPYEISKLTSKDKSKNGGKPKSILVEAVIETRTENKSSHKTENKRKNVDFDAIEVDDNKIEDYNLIEKINNNNVQLLENFISSNNKIENNADTLKHIDDNKSREVSKSTDELVNVSNDTKMECVPDIQSEVSTSETIKTENKVQTDEIKADLKSNAISSSTDSYSPTNKTENTIGCIEVMSDSDDSDFVEVTDSIEASKNAIEVVINPNISTTDDLFDDIFNQPAKKQEEKIKEDDYDKIEIVDDEPENKSIKNDIKTVSKKQEIKVSPIKSNLSLDELNKMKSDLVAEQNELLSERNLRERLATDITNQMYLEAQELLELFGVPYVIAPMEAESQCAFLNLIDLTDGTITDDSDIWLFGGQTVYKNFFNQKKHVLEYRAERIKQYFKLSREQMILLALLVGSDYTLGIQGIGPVTALEILSLFPPAKNIDINYLSQNELLSGLFEFKNWLKGKNLPGPGRTTLKSKLQNIILTDSFPSLQVVQAYLEPEVETCRDKFSWGKPDIVGLIDYAKEKFGWTRLKSEEILKPVMKKLEDKNIQKSIRDYFAMKHKIDFGTENAESKMSKRVKTAVNKIGKTKEELKAEQENVVKEKKTRRKKDKEEAKSITLENKTESNVVNETKSIDDKDSDFKIDTKKKTAPKRKIDGSKNIKKTNDTNKKEDKTDTNKNKKKIIKKSSENSEESQNMSVNDTNLIETENKMIVDLIRSENSDININILSQRAVLENESKNIEEKPRRRRRRDYVEPEPKPKIVKKTPVEVHTKETIPQKEKDKVYAIKSRLKAIEIYRKTNLSPKSNKRKKPARAPKDDAGLSESSDSS